ncbi:hypothetical protein QBC42DRAFT_260486 [Cladorrhinum samala]|uniref:Uncharacterized protein n=1 Tax=Cladorrhinum samala TaxID=585594 RepID=A0AAV9I056_9PEZI|nr:hypothetical protein QBC42DRAFT_260486 [Cladorrhinum samala]
MHVSSHLITAVALLAAPTIVLAGGPGQPSKIPDVSDGPDKVTLCGTQCDPITAVMLKCQRAGNNDVRKCACIPNSEPGAWYGYIHNCRSCLSDNSDSDFFDAMSSTLSQLMVSCTNAGGSVSSDGSQICAGNAMFEACTALRDNSTNSWASYESFRDDKEKTNTTFVLNLDDPYKPKPAASASASSSTTLTVSSSATATASGGAAQATGSGAASGNSSAQASNDSETVESSARGVHQAGSALGLLVAIGFGALLL